MSSVILRTGKESTGCQFCHEDTDFRLYSTRLGRAYGLPICLDCTREIVEAGVIDAGPVPEKPADLDLPEEPLPGGASAGPAGGTRHNSSDAMAALSKAMRGPHKLDVSGPTTPLEGDPLKGGEADGR